MTRHRDSGSHAEASLELSTIPEHATTTTTATITPRHWQVVREGIYFTLKRIAGNANEEQAPPLAPDNTVSNDSTSVCSKTSSKNADSKDSPSNASSPSTAASQESADDDARARSPPADTDLAISVTQPPCSEDIEGPFGQSTRAWSLYDNADDARSFRQSLVPAPLRIRLKRPWSGCSVSKGRHSISTPAPMLKPLPSLPAADDEFMELRKQGIVEKHTATLGDDAKIAEWSRPFRPPSRSLRSSLTRISLTPSEMLYPVGLLRSTVAEDTSKAERILGLRRSSRPPPVPPKTPSGSSQSTGLGSLPNPVTAGDSTLDPLNGRTAWLHVLTGTLVIFNCWGMTNAFGLFQAYYETEYLPKGTSPSAISWIGSTQLALVFGLGIPVGRLVDKGYFRLMFHGGSFIMLIGLFCTAWCKALWSLWLVQGLITGLGMGAVFCSGMMALMTWFDERKMGAAMGLGAAGSCIGGIVYILLARRFLAAKGFAKTMWIIGGIATATMIPANLVFRMRGQRHKLTSRKTTRQKLTWRIFAAPSYLLAAGGMFFAFAGVYFGFVYMILFASTELKLSSTASSDLLIYMLAANLPGRFLPSLISDKCIGPLNTIIPSVFLSAACIWL